VRFGGEIVRRVGADRRPSAAARKPLADTRAFSSRRAVLDEREAQRNGDTDTRVVLRESRAVGLRDAVDLGGRGKPDESAGSDREGVRKGRGGVELGQGQGDRAGDRDTAVARRRRRVAPFCTPSPP
jgi:hypothetical protein